MDTFDGMAWVGLVPFFMRVHTPGDHGAPWVSNFCETNVRTYARDGEGRAGIWFLSLDAARLGAVAVARASYRLPYFWSSMRLTTRRPGRDRVLLPAPGARPAQRAISQVRVRAGAPYQPGELGDRDHFLTARWVLFSVLAGRQFFARAEHQPWPLHRGAGPDRGRQPDHRGRAARTPRRAPGALLTGGRCPHRPAGELPLAGRDLRVRLGLLPVHGQLDTVRVEAHQAGDLRGLRDRASRSSTPGR